VIGVDIAFAEVAIGAADLMEIMTVSQPGGE
jgi:hypothetical protein